MAMVLGQGKAVQGASIGILMLKTRFPRILGDGGNLGTWPFPVIPRVIEGATPSGVVRGSARGLVDRFAAAACDLVADGADGIVTNCGFLILHQRRIAKACSVPVASSALLQLPWLERILPPGRRAGVVTVDAASLGPKHLECAGAHPDTPIEGIAADGELARVLLEDEMRLDVERARKEVVDAARCLHGRCPDLGAIVLECTNMPPYAADIAAATGLPVYDFHSLVIWFAAGLQPRRFQPEYR
ncbi:aspartate/glutamate racemase family protein [Thioalkalivibrio sp. HK1]|uniref:aspartate/glutamate racemase family protein n=1 Tax=Thioalkalivibrio sp. HK1 TaxID=1469245 RepID=UPI00056DE6B6|nr:aspartate/glutamate racemase family protein [Thioalkalivibrio sp. HK1]